MDAEFYGIPFDSLFEGIGISTVSLRGKQGPKRSKMIGAGTCKKLFFSHMRGRSRMAIAIKYVCTIDYEDICI